MRNSCTFKLAGPVTFRRSSSAIMERWGTNLQNIEKSMRSIYEPDGFSKDVEAKCKYWLQSGDVSVFTDEELDTIRLFLQTDQAGAEDLVVSYDCEPGNSRACYINGIKKHTYVAMKLFKDVWEDKVRESGVPMEGFDIDILDATPIAKLKQNPHWFSLERVIKASDGWSAKERYYYFAKQTVHCVDEKTEVLTKDGWVKACLIDRQASIAVFDGFNIQWETPIEWSHAHVSGDMIRFCGEEVDQLVTPNHKIVYESNRKFHTEEAAFVQRLKRVSIPTSGLFVGGDVKLQDWQVKLLVAIQADGYLESKNRVRFKFAKDRKIDRLISILREGGIDFIFHPWVDETTGGNIVGEIAVLCPDIIALFEDKKQWGSWLLKLSRRNLCTLIDELKYWDGSFTESYRHKREYYCSSVSENIDWIKTICHLVHKQGTIGEPEIGCTKLGINNRTNSIASVKQVVKYEGQVCCPTVSTGMFLIRRNGKISITHNSGNYDIQWAMFIMNILEKSGGKIVIPRDEGERFLLVYRSIFPEIVDRSNRIKRQAELTGIIYNMFGFPYQITDYHMLDSNMKDLVAWGPQSTVGEITRIAFSRLQEYIEAEHKQWDILADTHDSFLVQCRLLEALTCKSAMQKFMNQQLTSPIDSAKFFMKSETNIGFNWAPFKPSINDLGLREIDWK